MLPSQTARASGGARGGVYGRRRKRGKGPGGLPLPVGLVVLALLIGGGWLVFGWVSGSGGSGGGDGVEVAAATMTTGDTSRERTNPVTGPVTGRETSRSAEPAPIVERPVEPPVETLSQSRERSTSPAPVERARPEPSREDTTTTDRARTDPARTETPRTEPARTEPTRTATPSSRPSAPAPSGTTAEAAIQDAERLIRANRPVEARQVLNAALMRTGRNGSGAAALRQRLGAIAEDVTFSPRVYDADPLTMTYEVQSGDTLARIANRMGLAIDWRLIQRVNRISDPRRIRVGQRLKLVRGPFHVVVDKSHYRLDLYAGPPDVESEWVFIRSFTVGLGEGDSTPIGEFVVRQDSKLINPHWVNPRTGERFHADDPLNPIGEHWIGIEGVGPYSVHTGYGLHGTIEPESMGQQMSMGCVRLLPDDIELVYELLAEGISRVVIVP